MDALAGLQTSGNVAFTKEGGVYRLDVPFGERGFWAKLIQEVIAGEYSWVEQRWLPDGTYEDLEGGRNGGVVGTEPFDPLEEANGKSGVPIGIVVWVTPGAAEAVDGVVIHHYKFTCPSLLQSIRVTDDESPGTDGDGDVAGYVQRYDPLTNTWADDEPVWVTETTLGRLLATDHNGRPLYAIHGGVGPTKNFVSNVCPVLDAYGAPTGGMTVEYTPVTFPVGTTFGTPFCVTNPSHCCPPTWYNLHGSCSEVPFGGDPTAGACGPFASEAACLAINVDRWYCVAGVCTEVLAGECAPAGASGPFADEASCETAGCEDTSTVTVPCCPVPIRRTLHFTIGGGGGTYLFTFDGVDKWGQFSGTSIPCGQSFIFSLRCMNLGGGLYEWQASGNGTTVTVDSVSCDPFEIVVTIQLFQTDPLALCYGTTQTVTITD